MFCFGCFLRQRRWERVSWRFANSKCDIQMFTLFLAAIAESAKIEDIAITVFESGSEVLSEHIKDNKIASFALTENQTLSGKIKSSLKHAPLHSFFVLENGTYSVAGTMNFKNELSFKLDPRVLGGLHKHSAQYSLKLTIYAKGEEPIMREIAKVDYKANGEVFDNFTDVEWDFQEPHKDPKDVLINGFAFAMLAPIAVLLILLCVNGINCGYFPRNFFDAIFSLTFVAALGCFLAYFIVFWRKITFEVMLKQLCIIIPALAILLRLALVGRAKMVDRYEAEVKNVELKQKTE